MVIKGILKYAVQRRRVIKKELLFPVSMDIASSYEPCNFLLNIKAKVKFIGNY